MQSEYPIPLPALFVPHGAPTFALQPGAAGAALAAAACNLGPIEAVMVISAHWTTEVPTLGIATRPDTLHDFYGFPKELNAIRYPVMGSVKWAMEARALLEEAGFEMQIDPHRGLDHGAWIPLRLMFPKAEIPVFTLSVQSLSDPAHHYRLGRALAPLRDARVLILGSGNLTHNLRHFAMLQGASAPPDYVPAFQGWVHERLAEADIPALLAYRNRAPGAELAHPTDEHWLPFYVALGAAGEHPVAERVYSGIEYNMLAMDTYAFRSGHDFSPTTH